MTADAIHPGWTQRTCGRCLGAGQVAVYSAMDFEGPGECPDCGGNGAYWESPKGRAALYPGGPFTGAFPKVAP